jgi:hypothetical protein
MTTPNAKVLVVHVAHVIAANAANAASAKTSDVIAANSSDVTTAKSTHVTSAKAAHVASAKATHVASAKATHVASASASASAAGLCTRGNKATGKQCTRQNHHRSSSHNILHLVGRTFRHRALSDVGAFQRSNANVAMDWRWEWLLFVSTKFSFNQPMNANLVRAKQMRSRFDRAFLQVGRDFSPHKKVDGTHPPY